MASKNTSSKWGQINKATAVMVGIIAGASFITVFSLVASNALMSKRSFQAKVIAAKVQARDQLAANIKAVDALAGQYTAFVETSENVLGGNPKGTGEKDGDNARIVLDALPSKYDFPALASSLEKLTSSYKTSSITASDDELTQSKELVGTPQLVEMPFELSVSTDLQSGLNFITTLEKSIRPINIISLSISATEKEISLGIKAKTYYQPAKTLTIGSKEIK